jgi:hypothetical protein
VNEDFRFETLQWRSVMRSDIEVPSDSPLRVILDCSFTANEREPGRTPSDRSALVAGVTQAREGDGVNEFTLIDVSSDRWKGIALADAALDFCLKLGVKDLQVERIPGTELLKDTLALRAKERGMEPLTVRLFNPCVIKNAKNSRIMRLQTLFNAKPPAIRIRYGTFVEMLMEEVEDFVPCVGNRGRQINILDACALCAGFR